MSDSDDTPITRRRVLGGTAAAGVGGLFGGAGIWAVVTDSRRFQGRVVGAALDVTVTCGDDGACTSTDGGAGVAVEFDDVTPGGSGATELCIGVAGAPAQLWLRATAAAPVDTAAGERLRLTLGDSDGTPLPADCGDCERIEDWSLTEFHSAFADGRVLTWPGADRVVDPGGRRCLTLEWSLPSDADLAPGAAEIELMIAAVQHHATRPSRNPWGSDTDD